MHTHAHTHTHRHSNRSDSIRTPRHPQHLIQRQKNLEGQLKAYKKLMGDRAKGDRGCLAVGTQAAPAQASSSSDGGGVVVAAGAAAAGGSAVASGLGVVGSLDTDAFAAVFKTVVTVMGTPYKSTSHSSGSGSSGKSRRKSGGGQGSTEAAGANLMEQVLLVVLH